MILKPEPGVSSIFIIFENQLIKGEMNHPIKFMNLNSYREPDEISQEIKA